MSLNRFVRQLNPIQENKTNYVNIVKTFVIESSLSKSQLEKPAGKGPNSGTPRIEIFAKKIADGEDHILNDGNTIINPYVIFLLFVFSEKALRLYQSR